MENHKKDSEETCPFCGSVMGRQEAAKGQTGRLSNYEYVLQLNRFIKRLAKLLLVAGVVFLTVGAFASDSLTAFLIIGIMPAFIFLLCAVNLLWLASLGSNITSARQAKKKGLRRNELKKQPYRNPFK